ncbi:MAG TPA: ATP-binding protein, partial [Spirochaetia bacterium]|nr:ATP-binding protein [Spirochaetia bacterium]
ASASLGFGGAIAAATISGLLGGPFVTHFVNIGGSTPGLVWIVRLILFELFGLLTGTVATILRDQAIAHRETSERLMQAQKLEAIGRLTGGVAHDFNNMLTAIGGYANLLSAHAASIPEISLIAEELMEVVARSGSLTRQLLAISRKQIMEPRPVAISTSIHSLAKMLARLLGERIKLELSVSPETWEAVVDPVQFDQVLLNLAVNAADAMPEGGTLLVHTENLTVDPVFHAQHPDLGLREYVMVSVTDSGQGIDSEIAERIFEPFFTTKPVGKGTGLGLSTAYGIVKQLGGDIWFTSDPGRGSTFRVCLPRAAASPATAKKPARAGKRRVSSKL